MFFLHQGKITCNRIFLFNFRQLWPFIINSTFMEISLKGRRALVGGASRGLGRAIALQLAASGAQVTLLARNEQRLKEVLAQLSTVAGQTHNYLVVDFADFPTFSEVMKRYF